MSITSLTKPTVGATGWGGNVNQNFTDIEDAFKGTQAGDLFLLNEQGSKPSNPSTGDWKLYFKADGLYTLEDDGTESGPLGIDGGVWVLLSTQTASNSSMIDFTSDIDSTYRRYAIFIDDLTPATDAVDLYMRISTDGGSTWKSGASDYDYTTRAISPTGWVDSVSGGGAAQMLMTGGSGTLRHGNGAVENGHAEIYINNPAGASKYTTFNAEAHYINENGRAVISMSTSFYKATTAVDGIRLYFSSGNISSGTFKLYGLK